MNELNKISSLKFWCQKVLPLVYDDSLSYYEVLAKIGEKLNEVINNTNEQNEKLIEMSTAIDEFMRETDEKYVAFTEQINTMFNEKSDELENTVSTAINDLTNTIDNKITDFDSAWQEFLREYQVTFGIENGFGDNETNAISQKTLTDAYYNNINEKRTTTNDDITNPANWVYAGISSNTAYQQLEDSIYYAYNPGTNKRISYLNYKNLTYTPKDKNENNYAIQITPKTPTSITGITNYAFYGFYYDDEDNIIGERITDGGAWAETPLYIELNKYIKFAISLKVDDETADGAVLNINNLSDYIEIYLFETKIDKFNKEYITNDESAIMQKIQNKYNLTNKNVVFSQLTKYSGVWANYNISSTATGIAIGTTGKYLNPSYTRLCSTYQYRDDGAGNFKTSGVYNLGDIKFINIVRKNQNIEYGVRAYNKELDTESILTDATYTTKDDFYDVSEYPYIGIVIKYIDGSNIDVSDVFYKVNQRNFYLGTS